MSEILENDEWRIECFLDWRPKVRTETCGLCGGAGVTGGGFKDLDGEVTCQKCGGAKVTLVRPTSRPPEIPAGLREHMRRAYWDYKNAKEPTK